MSELVELRRRSRAGIIAVPYPSGRRCRPVRLPDGAIVELPTPDQRAQAPDSPKDSVGVAVDGDPATVHHFNLGLVASYLAFAGVYLLSSGDVAAIYGAEAIPID